MGPKYNIKINYLDGTTDLVVGDITSFGYSLFSIKIDGGANYIHVPFRNVKSVTLEEIR
jgi:hypothetical protein